MKTNHQTTTDRKLAEQPGKSTARISLLLACGWLLMATTSSWAVNSVTWDASAGSGPNDGSGNWLGTGNWWSVAGGTNYTWAGGGDEEYVTFGSGTGTAGTYLITNNIALDQPYNVTFASPGSYTITTDGTDAGEMQTIISGGGTGSYAPSFYVATNVSAAINVPWRIVASSDIFLGYNSSLTFGQGSFGTMAGITFKGQSGPGLSTVSFTNGTLAGNGLGTTTADGLTLNVTGTAVVNFGTRFDIARSANAAADYPLATAVVNVGGPGASAQLNVNTSAGNNTGNHFQVSRGGSAVLNVLPGGLISTMAGLSSGSVVAGNLRIAPDSSGPGTVNVSGGTVNVGIGAGGSSGSSSANLGQITLFDAESPSASGVAILNVSGGVVAAAKISIGNTGSSTWAANNPTNQINITGGTVYLDAGNVQATGPTGTHYAFNLSGGTIGATANWSPACSLPVNLTNINGNITFQAADANGNPFNMAFSGPVTGQGGLNKTGGGTLTLSGTNTYSGSTTVSNGTLVIFTGSAPTNGSVTVDASAGTSEVSVQVAGTGQYWSISSLTCSAGTPTADFNFINNLMPSTTMAPIQVNGNLAFTATPDVTVDGSAIPTGTFPLITYTGALSGVPPTSVTINLTGGSALGYLANITGTKTIALVVTSSTFSPAIKWAVGNGAWDIRSSANWVSNSLTVTYQDGDAVIFDDTASGASPISVTLNTTVQPASISANNATKSYIISGTGAIAGPGSLTVLGAGSLTMATTNTYNGGTTVTGPGHLNINYGGNGTANSAIGTGPLTLDPGAVIDNTSGNAITLLTPVPEFWEDSFSFAGSTNLNLGTGAITLANGLVNLTVVSNTLEVDGIISDNGAHLGLEKLGAGTLVLSNQNSFTGGLTLSAGTLDLNYSGADGTGKFNLSGGTLDNTSGSLVTLNSASFAWGTFIFNGTSDMDLGQGNIAIATSVLTINSNTIYTEGELNGANTSLTVNGPGAWTIQGSALNTGTFGVTINGATVNCNRQSPYYCFSGGIAVNTNSLLMMLNPDNFQLTTTASITLGGGLVEFNGDSETFQSLAFNSAGGIVRNSAVNTTSLLQPSANISLVGTNCDFDVSNDAAMTLAGVITNTGTLLKTSGGVLTLVSNNTFTGSTIIAGGTLALADPLDIGAGSISNSVLINVTSNATLDVSGRGDQTLTLNSGQTLAGDGSINGNLVTTTGSVLMPGNGIGTLTVTNNITLAGAAVFELNRASSQNSSELVSILGTLTGGGTLAVTNAGPALQVGDTFQLFPSAVIGFAAISLPVTDANGYAYTWNTNIGVNGSISVASASIAVNPHPGPVQFTLSGRTLALSWPTNLGWELQEQTNSLATGLGTNWVVVAGSTAVTTTNITVNPTNGSMFFRLALPQP